MINTNAMLQMHRPVCLTKALSSSVFIMLICNFETAAYLNLHFPIDNYIWSMTSKREMFYLIRLRHFSGK